MLVIITNLSFRIQGSGLWWQLRCKIYICGEAATTISNFSFLISHSNEAFKWNQRATRPHGYPRTLNPEPIIFHNIF